MAEAQNGDLQPRDPVPGRGMRTYREELPSDISPMRQLLETYSGIPPEEVEALLYSIVRQPPLSLVPCAVDGGWS